MQTSAKGVAALEYEEGVVLRAYRCPAGVWTIGAGITSAAGVGKVGPGMVITRAQATTMLQAALRENYEPRVGKAMVGRYPKQNEFDAGVLFDFNTGAIHRASWVRLWVAKALPSAIAAKFRQWNKGGGKVLPGLVKRRERELAILFDGVYPVTTAAAKAPVAAPKAPADAAVWSLPTSPEEKLAVGQALARLGYAPDNTRAEIPAHVVVAFQEDHGLTADGIIGRATLSTLQRRIDAAAKAKPVAASAAVGAPASATDTVDQITGLPHVGAVLIAGAALVGLYLCWRYRDVIAAKVQRKLPRLAVFLRSF